MLDKLIIEDTDPFVKFSPLEYQLNIKTTQYIHIVITVAWSEVPDHVKLTGSDHQIKREAERRVWSSDPHLSTRRDPALQIKLLL